MDCLAKNSHLLLFYSLHSQKTVSRDLTLYPDIACNELPIDRKGMDEFLLSNKANTYQQLTFQIISYSII